MTGLKGDLPHHLQVNPKGDPHEDVVVVQPLYSPYRSETVPRKCVDEVDPKLQGAFIVQTGTLRETWTEDSSFDCLSLVDQPHVVRKIFWEMVHQGRRILNLSCGSAANCATVLRIVTSCSWGHNTFTGNDGEAACR